MTFSLRARVVFPVDRPPIEGGVVTIEGERIVAVGAKAQADGVTDLGDVALLPGLVNTHTHLEFSHLRRPLGRPGMSLTDWIRLVIAERGRSNYTPMLSFQDGIRLSIKFGVTSVGEISIIELPVYAATRVDLTLFAEVIGFSRARAASAFTATQKMLEMFQIQKTHNPVDHEHVALGISPHAPYTVSPSLLSKLIKLAREEELPVAMHLAESEEEIELLCNGTGPFQELLEERSMWDAEAIPRGSRPMDYLRMLAEAPRALVIHGNYLDDEERAFLAANAERMSLVYCPRTHAYFGHPRYPLTELLNAGVRVALGTDSLASNPDLNLFAEMRQVAKTFPKIDPHAILRMGTLSGAEALERETESGSITPGKLANLVAIPLEKHATSSAEDVLNSLLANDTGPPRVWCRGLAWEA